MSRKLLDKAKIQIEIVTYLKRYGAASAHTLCHTFKITQPSLSRILAALKDKLIIIGRARETKYALIRNVEGIAAPVPIYEILEDSSYRHFGLLHALEPHGFYFESKLPDIKSSLYPDLPYFLNDLRPTGFLGRLIPTQQADLNLPEDIRLWTAEHCLKFLSNREWNPIGNLILGEKSFKLYLQNRQTIQQGIPSRNRSKQYLRYATDILSIGDAGSSAAGEQAKFITLLLPDIKHVIVKFSPPTDTDIGRRIADLLICEHLALQALKKNSQEVAHSEILIKNERVFLEVERFDRLSPLARRGLISLASLSAEFSGNLSSWSKTVMGLIKHKILPSSFYQPIRLRELFGELIGNNDMHANNLSFFTEGLKITAIAPTYDMLPMLFMPRNYQIIEKEFSPSLPLPEDIATWQQAYVIASEFWDMVLHDNRISNSFKKIAHTCQDKLSALKH